MIQLISAFLCEQSLILPGARRLAEEIKFPLFIRYNVVQSEVEKGFLLIKMESQAHAAATDKGSS